MCSDDLAGERNPFALSEAIADCDRRVAAIHAERAVLVAALHDAMPDQPREWAREEIAVTCRVSFAEADARLRTSLSLAGGLPETVRALASGAISWPHAVALADATRRLTADEARWVELEVLGDERARTPWQVAFRARRAALAVHPETADRPAPVSGDRSLDGSRGLDGSVCFAFRLPAPEATVVQTFLDATSGREGRDDERPPEVRRADALLDLIRSALDAGTLPSGGDGRRPHVQITSELTALQAGRYGAAEVDGRPCVGSQLRELVCESDVSVTWTDHDGTILDQGRTTRLVSARLLARLDARDAHCRFPGCAARARRCRAHHIRHWADGGPTDLQNLVLVCDRHHHAIHDGGWTVAVDGQAVRWRSPAGLHVTELADLDQLHDPDTEGDLDDVDHTWIVPEWELWGRPPPESRSAPAPTAAPVPGAPAGATDLDQPPF